ncbi:L-xylulose reductase [Colletotrichum viniferum]|nr:L-xylulose reductase [Colletotrichum viniferum]
MSRSLNPMNGGDFIHDDERKLDVGSALSRLSLANKTAIITGAGGGIGYSVAVAYMYAEMGCNIAIWYHTNQEAPKRAEELSEKYKVKCKAYQVDVRSWDAVKKATDQAVADLNGRLDILVANSGVPWTQGPMIDAPLEQYKDVTQTGLDGVYYCAKAAAKHWRR